MGSPDFVSGGIRVDNSDGNSEDFTVGLTVGVTFDLIDSTMLGRADCSKTGELLGIKEGALFGVSE